MYSGSIGAYNIESLIYSEQFFGVHLLIFQYLFTKFVKYALQFSRLLALPTNIKRNYLRRFARAILILSIRIFIINRIEKRKLFFFFILERIKRVGTRSNDQRRTNRPRTHARIHFLGNKIFLANFAVSFVTTYNYSDSWS